MTTAGLTRNAVRIGMARGWTMFRHLMTTADGIFNTIFWNAIPLTYLVLNRDTPVEGTTLSLAAVALPGFIGLAITLSAYGPAYYIAAEREDGTLLRARAIPNGIVAYVTGVLTQATLETVVSILVLLIPGLLLFAGIIVPDLRGWLVFASVVVLGLLATLPVGIIMGSIIKSPRLVGGAGLLVIGGLAIVSGIFIPIQAFPAWLQTIAQLLPSYWAGVGMRSVFLPEEAAAWEVGGTWRPLEMYIVLTAWAVAGSLIAPGVLRRMARRATGSSVEANRQQALQRM
jgi:ABC-2 type transport system permease protein